MLNLGIKAVRRVFFKWHVTFTCGCEAYIEEHCTTVLVKDHSRG